MDLRPDLSLFALDHDLLVFSEQAQRLAVLNHSAGMIVRKLSAGACPGDIARELAQAGHASGDEARHWVSSTIETLRANGPTATGNPGEAAGADADAGFPPASEGLPLGTFPVVAEKTYRLLGTRALVRFGLQAQNARPAQAR